MSAKVLAGEEIAAKILEALKKEIEDLNVGGTPAQLVALKATENPGAKVYLKAQKRSCEEVGVAYNVKELPETASQDEVLAAVDELNADKSVTGIILMMPMPEGVDAREVQVRIAPAKDVEGMHPENMGRLFYGGHAGICPCTARGALELYLSSGEDLKGKEIVVVGHSEIVGKPLALMLLSSQMESATPTVCHIATTDLSFHTKRADVIFVACGVPNLIKADMIKPGATVIDIGINRVNVLDEDGEPVLNDKGRPKKKTVGDVDYDAALEVAGMITPVPGGVGPMTTAMLIKNTVTAARSAVAAAEESC